MCSSDLERSEREREREREGERLILKSVEMLPDETIGSLREREIIYGQVKLKK